MDTTIKTITIGGQPFNFAGYPQDSYFRDLESAARSNEALFNLIWTDIAPGSVIFDVGANIGLTSVLFRKIVPHSTVYSFEPSPKAHRCLLRTLQANETDTERVFQIGLSDRPGTTRFREMEMLASSFIPPDDCPSADDIDIELTTIDMFVWSSGVSRVDFIKIDVAGFEIEVIRGAFETLHRFRPRVFLEFNSYSLIGHRNMNPRLVFDAILKAFPSVKCWRDGQWHPIKTFLDKQEFIYRNLVEHACVDDLLCGFEA